MKNNTVQLNLPDGTKYGPSVWESATGSDVDARVGSLALRIIGALTRS